MSTFSLDIQRSAISSSAAFTTSDLQQRFDQYKSYLSGAFPVSGSGEIDPGEVYKFTVSSLENFTRDFMKINVPKDMLRYVASSNGGRGVNLKIPEIAMVTETAAQLGATAVFDSASEIFKGSGIDVPQGVEGIGMMTFDAITSGKPIGPALGKAVATGVGALAGAKVGAALGTIVPGIGNVVGAAAGAIVTAIVGQLFKQYPPPPPLPVNPQLLSAANAAQYDQERFNALNKLRGDLVASCKTSEIGYWANFDQVLYEISRQWEDFELQIGFKFPLRWFDDTQGPAFYANPKDLRRIGAAWAMTYQAAPANTFNAQTTKNYHTYLAPGDILTTRCMLGNLGCLYPSSMGAMPYNPGINNRFGEDNKYLGFNTFQVSKAMQARGAIWVPPPLRSDCERHVGYPTSGNYSSAAGTEAYVRYIEGLADDQIVKNLRLGIASKLVSADLVRTSAVYKTFLDSMVGEVLYGKSFNARNIDPGFSKVEKANNLYNNAALAAGAGIFGFSLWRAFR